MDAALDGAGATLNPAETTANRSSARLPECRNTDYLGRVGLYELLTVTPDLRRLFGPTWPRRPCARRPLTRECGLRVSAALQIAAGMTTFEEVVQILPPLAD